jgi:hypothetical protein
MPRVQRGPVVLAASIVAFSAFVCGASYASAKSASPRAAKAAQAQTITLRGRRDISGPWRRLLRIKLKRGGYPIAFTLCALVDSKTIPPACHARPGVKIPEGSRLRLEQSRSTRGPWRVVGVSFSPYLDARLSNDVSGNRFGTVHYRVTLRNANGTILRTSNPYRVIWHR